MRKLFSLIAAVLFTGSMMAADVVFSGEDFTGGSAHPGSEFSITKSGVTVTANRALGTGSELRVFASDDANGTSTLTVAAGTATITSIVGEFTSQTKMTFDPQEPNASDWTIEATKQIRLSKLTVTISGGTPATPAEQLQQYINDLTTLKGFVEQFVGIVEGADQLVQQAEQLIALGNLALLSGDEATIQSAVSQAEAKVAEVINIALSKGKEGLKAQLDQLLTGVGECDECPALVAAAKELIDAIAWDPSKSVSQNVEAIMQKANAIIERTQKQIDAILNPAGDITTCAEAAEAALSVSDNNVLYNDGAVYTIQGYVTGIKIAYSSQHNNLSFWMADTKDGGEVLQAYRCTPESAEALPEEGDLVEVTGSLTKYNSTPEFAQGCSCVIIEKASTEPQMEYFLSGTFNSWVTGDESYRLYPNPAADGEYMCLVDLVEGAGLKVVGTVEGMAGSTIWYPDGMDNEYIVPTTDQYMVYFRPDGQGGEGWHYGYIYVEPYQEPQVPLYDVAEAIAAELAKDDVIQVRGIITKIEFKGKNFAKYGSVCFYVKDASGAEGEFEFFNCYSLDEKKFTVSDPEFDETSTQWAQFDAVTDEDGNVIEVGDLIIAQGKYEFYNNQKHELQQNCYLIDVQKGVGPEPQTIELDVVYCEALYFTDEDSGVRGLQFNLYKDYDSSTETVTYPDFYIGVAPKSETALAGTYSANDIYFVEMDIAENTTVEAEEILSDFVVTWLRKDEEGNNWYQYTFKFLGDDGNTYIINLEETDTRAYDDNTGAEVEIDEEGGSSVEPGYYLVGSFTEWEPLSSYMLSLNQAAEAEEYMIEVRLFAGNEFKVVQVDEAGAWTWFPDGENNNYVVSEDLGIVTVYFRPNYDGGSDWFYNCIYIAQGGQPDEWDFVTAQYDQYDDGSVDVALLTSEGWSRTSSGWSVDVAGTALILNIFPQNSEDMSDLTGNYSSEDGTLDIDYSYALTWDGQSSSFDVLLFTSGTVTVAFNQDQSGYILTYDLLDADGNEYAGTAEIPLAAVEPVDMTFEFAYNQAATEVTVTPSDDENKWDYFLLTKEEYESYFESDPNAVAEYSYEYWGDDYAEAGARSLTFSGESEGEYVLVVYGCNGGVTTPGFAFEFTILAPVNQYYLVGTFNNWTPSSDYVLTANEAAETEEYMIRLAVEENDEFKVVYVAYNEETGEREWTWFPAQGGNYVIYHDYAGIVNVYCRPNYDGNEDWYYNCLYVQKYDPQVIDINIQSGVIFSNYTSSQNPWWRLEAEDDEYHVRIDVVLGITTIAGEYTFDDLDVDYTYVSDIETGTKVVFTDGSFTVTVEEGGVVIFNGSFIGNDFNTYNIYLRYAEPTPEQTVDLQITGAQIAQDYYGNNYLYGTSADGTYVQFYLPVDEEGNPVDGEYANGSYIEINEKSLNVYTDSYSVETQEDGSIIITAEILCYGNTLFRVRMTDAESFPQGIEEITADGQTVKVLRNGHVFILRGDKIFNLQGILVK